MKNQTFLFLFLFSFLLSFSKFEIKETPFSEYNFDASECKVIQHHASRIFVPAHTFYFDGKLYSGQVNLKYREFVDQLDIIINQIPMDYSENDHHHMLESNGMFELYAYGNGKLLSFAPFKKITVQLATPFNMNGGETFTMDRSKNVWEKNTPFGTLTDANTFMSDNSTELWGDSYWQDMEGINNSDLVDANGQFWRIQNQAFKTIQVDKMALYNCDKILNENTIPLIAEFKLEGYSNQSLKSEVYVVYKNRNAVLTYHPEQFLNEFKLLPDEDFTIFSIANDGKIAVLDPAFLFSFDVKKNINKKVVFPMKVYTSMPKTKEELSAITGI